MSKEKIINKDEISTKLVVGLSILAVFIFIALITIGWFVGTYNTLVQARQDINNQFSNVKTEYQRRADLFYNMVEVTKSYSKFEKDTMIAVTKARGGNFQGTQQQQMQELNKLDSAFSRLLVTFEAYPNLKADEQYNKLLDQIQNTENRIQIARTDYNALVRNYNSYIQKFPTTMLAGMYGFYDQTYFWNEVGTDSAPKLNMN